MELSELETQVPTLSASVAIAGSKQIGVGVDISSDEINDVVAAIIVATVSE